VNLRLRLLPGALRRKELDPPLLRELTEHHDESEIVAVAVRAFLSSMNTVHWEERDRWSREDLLALYEYQSARVIERLRDEMPPAGVDDLSLAIRPVMTPTVSFRWMVGDARLQVCQSLLREHTAQAVGRWRERGLSSRASKRLLRALDTWPRQEDPWVESVLLDMAGDSWSRGSPAGWLDFAAWKRERSDPRELARLHGPHLERLRAIHDSKEKTVQAQKIFSQFALDLCRGDADAEAEELYQELLAWDAVAGAEDEVALYRANACLLLALLQRRAGNVPEALRLARQAVEESGEREFGLLYQTYGSRGWKQNLKPYAVRFIDALRRDPDASLEDPFENFRPEPAPAPDRANRTATPDRPETDAGTSAAGGAASRTVLLILGALAFGLGYVFRKT
jgi:tetratricopeptide (TPR) repeat protein